jgi:DnaJ-class molecular chaperone
MKAKNQQTQALQKAAQKRARRMPSPAKMHFMVLRERQDRLVKDLKVLLLSAREQQMALMAWKICQRCEGHGWVMGEKPTCPICRGRGEIRNPGIPK